MTYCCGLLVEEGLVMIADTRTNAGVDNISVFRKLHLFEEEGRHVIAIATAGSLSVTQTALSLLEEGFRNPETGAIETLRDQTSMFRAAQFVGHVLSKASADVKAALQGSGVDYGATILLGGQIVGGPMKLFMIYGVGNAIECGPDSPFLQIGEPKYGKPILDRALTHATSIPDAVKLGLISFDLTMRSNLAVGAPLDLVTVRRDELKFCVRHRIDGDDAYFRELSESWATALREAAASIPEPSYGI